MPAGVTVRNLNIAVKVNATGALTKLNSIAKALKQLQSKIATTEALQQRLKKIEEDMSTVGTASSDAAKGVEEVAKATKKVSSSAPKVKRVSDSFSRLLKTLRSITIYRALTTAIIAVINMMKEGYETFSKFIKLTNDKRLNNAVSGLTYEITKLKLALGSLGAESVDNAQAPLSGLSDTLYAIINAFTWLSASLNGADTYFTVNKKSVEEYSKELNEAKRSIMGFDEINKLSADSLVTDKLYDEKEVGFIGKLFDKLKDGYDKTLPGFWQVFSKIGEIKEFFEDETVIKITGKFKSFGDTLKESFSTAKEEIGKVFEDIKTFKDKISAITTLFNPIGEAFKLIDGWITRVFKDGLTEANKWVKEEIGKICDSFNGIWQGIKSAFEATKEWFKDKGIEIKLFCENLPEKVKEFYNDAKDWIADKYIIVKTKLGDFFETIKEKFNEAKEWIKDKYISVSVKMGNIKSGVESGFNSAKEWLKDKYISVSTKIGDIVSKVKSGFGEAVTWLEDNAVEVKSKVDEMLSPVKDKFNEAKGWVEEQVIGVKSKVDEILSPVKDKFNEAKDWIDTQKLNVATKVEGFLTKLETSFSDASTWLGKQKLTISVGFTDFLADLKEKLQALVKWLKETPLKILLKFGLFGKDNSDADGDGLFSDYPTGAGASTGSSGSSSSSGSKFEKVTLRANGGFPSVGSMFIAGEAGPELVGSINGRTGVASGEEVTGIKTAVYAIGEAIVDAINNKDMNASIQLDDGTIYKANQRGAKRVGNSLISFSN